MEEKSKLPLINGKDVWMGRVPSKYKERYLEERSKTNVSRMFFLSVYIIVVQIVLNIINIVKPQETKGSNISVYIFLSLFTLMIGIIFVIISVLCRKEKIKSAKAKTTLSYTLLYVYFIIQMTFFTLNIQMDTGGINSYVIGLIIASLVFVVTPIQMISVVTASLIYVVVVMMMQGGADVWQSVMLTDTWANLLIITALVALVSYRMYDMYLSDFLSKMKLEESIAHANAVASTDSLTGLYNRRGFFHNLNERWDILTEHNPDICMMIFDIDYFKKYNDRFGHLAGDECLCKVAGALKGFFDKCGAMVCRFGGEEFLAYFLPKDEQEAALFAECARKATEDLQIKGIGDVSGNPYLTISVGYITVPAKDANVDQLIHKADMALYESKKRGRNTATRYDESLLENAQHVRGCRISTEDKFGGEEKRGTED